MVGVLHDVGAGAVGEAFLDEVIQLIRLSPLIHHSRRVGGWAHNDLRILLMVVKSYRRAGIPSRLRRVATAATVRPRRRATAWSGIFPRKASARASQCRNGDWRPS